MPGKTNTPDLLLEARLICRLLCPETEKLVGWLYQWENGTLMPMWLNGSPQTVKLEVNPLTARIQISFIDNAWHFSSDV